MSNVQMTLDEINALALSALVAAGASEAQAQPLAAAVAAAEADGIASHGLAYVPTYCEHLRCANARTTRAQPACNRPPSGGQTSVQIPPWPLRRSS